MVCRSCRMEVLPYLQKCDLCGAVVQSPAEARQKKQEWEMFPASAQQEFANKITEARAKAILARQIKERHLYEYLIACGILVFGLTFLGDFIARGGFWKGFLCGCVGGLCGMAGCSLLYRLGGSMVAGFLIMPAAYILSDFLKPGGSYALTIIKSLAARPVAAIGVSAAEPYAAGYATGGYATIFLFSFVAFAIFGACLGQDIKRKTQEGEM